MHYYNRQIIYKKTMLSAGREFEANDAKCSYIANKPCHKWHSLLSVSFEKVLTVCYNAYVLPCPVPAQHYPVYQPYG